MGREILEKSRRILDENYPIIITAMGNLAVTLGDQGNLDKDS
jgi:hypothetical protein